MNFDRIKREFNEKPLEVAAVATAAVIALTKVVDTVSSARSKNAYAKQVKRSSKRR